MRLQWFSLVLSLELLYYVYFLIFKNYCKCSKQKLMTNLQHFNSIYYLPDESLPDS